MPEQDEFARTRHLLLACLALLLTWAWSRGGWDLVQWLGASWPWDPADVVLRRLVWLCGVATIAWLAFARFDTRSGVRVIGPSWWNPGWEPLLLYAVLLAVHVGSHFNIDADTAVRIAQTYIGPMHDEWLGMAWGWAIASTLIGAVAEELVFRALIQRALAGYMREWIAVIVQAMIFQIAHDLIYQTEYLGAHVISGAIYGYAFMRTRSLITPVLMHAGLNLVHTWLYVAALS